MIPLQDSKVHFTALHVEDWNVIKMFNNKNFDFEEFKRLYDAADGEPEFEIIFKDKKSDYMIIKYSDGPSFQRLGFEDASGEIYYKNLDELYEADLIDGINLKRDWYQIKEIFPNSYNGFETYCAYCNIEYKGELNRG